MTILVRRHQAVAQDAMRNVGIEKKEHREEGGFTAKLIISLSFSIHLFKSFQVNEGGMALHALPQIKADVDVIHVRGVVKEDPAEEQTIIVIRGEKDIDDQVPVQFCETDPSNHGDNTPATIAYEYGGESTIPYSSILGRADPEALSLRNGVVTITRAQYEEYTAIGEAAAAEVDAQRVAAREQAKRTRQADKAANDALLSKKPKSYRNKPRGSRK